MFDKVKDIAWRLTAELEKLRASTERTKAQRKNYLADSGVDKYWRLTYVAKAENEMAEAMKAIEALTEELRKAYEKL